MNEDEVLNTPVEDDESLIIDPKAFGIEDNTTEDTVEPTTEEVSTPTETKEEEMDFTPLLNKLSKEVKYLDEEVKIEDVDFLKNTFQKGLDYDRKVERLKELENSEELTYIREKAKDSGMTPTEYIKAIKDFETRQQVEQEEIEIAEMVENGVSETIARKVIETNRIAKELEQEKFKLKQEQDKLALEKKKEQDNQDFLRAYPEIDIKSIPKEVFVDAEKIGLIGAYSKFENAKLKQELELARQNQKNEKTSPVGSVTEHGGVELDQEDDFLRGFFSK